MYTAKAKKPTKLSYTLLVARAKLCLRMYTEYRMPYTSTLTKKLLFLLCCLFSLTIIYRTSLHGTKIQTYVTGENVFDDINIPPIVWKWGLCQLSDVHDSVTDMIRYAKDNANDTPPKILDLTLFSRINDGDLICLPDSQIDYFISAILPNITSYFSLLSHSGTSRTFISRLHHQANIHKKLIRSKYLLKWFVANYDGNINKKQYDYHNKLESIPLGYDFHTPWMTTNMFEYYIHNRVHGPKMLGHYSDPYPNYIHLMALLNNGEVIEHNLNHRIRTKVYLDRALNAEVAYHKTNYFGFNYSTFLQYYHEHKHSFDEQLPWLSFGGRYQRKYPYRAGLYAMLRDSAYDLWHIENVSLSQYELFTKRSKFVFVLSPFGNAWDCFRTWESILFGHIVLVQSTAGKGVDEMFMKHELPVVIVDDMNSIANIDEKQLNEWYQKYKHLTYFENANTRYKMTNLYWINYMKTKTLSLIP